MQCGTSGEFKAKKKEDMTSMSLNHLEGYANRNTGRDIILEAIVVMQVRDGEAWSTMGATGIVRGKQVLQRSQGNNPQICTGLNGGGKAKKSKKDI